MKSGTRARRDAKQQWYVAVLLFRFEVERDADEDLPVRHEMRLIRAHDDQAAYERALVIGRTQQREYQNVHGQLVRWRFLGLHDLVWLHDGAPGTATIRHLTPRDGVCLYSFRLPASRAWEVLPKEELRPFYEIEARKTSGPKLVDP